MIDYIHSGIFHTVAAEAKELDVGSQSPQLGTKKSADIIAGGFAGNYEN